MVEVGFESRTPISSDRFSRKGEFATRLIAGEVVLVPVRGQVGDLDSVYIFNELGTFIWTLLDGNTCVADIVRAICEQFVGAPEPIESETLQFLSTLQEWGIVERSVERGS